MSRRPKLVVVGSANMDLVVRTERIPAPGETVLGGDFATVPGGKGANQAVAAARLGADVFFVGKIGSDAFGDALRAELIGAGIAPDYLQRDTHASSGVALICVDAQGQNAITVAPGANRLLTPEDIDAARAGIQAADALIVQLEIPPETVLHAIETAQEFGVRVVLNPAPIRHTNPLPVSLLQMVDVLTPNEHEAANLLGSPTSEGLDFAQAASRLKNLGIPEVIITLGAQGSLLCDAEGVRPMEAFPVTPVDTTAAGDCFTGALAVALAEGQALEGAARFASAAAALSVTRAGAQPSLPYRAEVEAFLAINRAKNRSGDSPG